MPTYKFHCERCGTPKKRYKTAKEPPPRFCGRECKERWQSENTPTLKWPLTPEIQSQIKTVCQTPDGNLTELARNIGYPRGRLQTHAIRQGWTRRQKGGSLWKNKETEILIEHIHRSAEAVRKKLQKAGFNRSESSIVAKRKKIQIWKCYGGYTAKDVALGLGVAPGFVLNMIDKKYLKARRWERNKTSGNFFHIEELDIKRFIRDHPNEIDITKVDKHWFIGILTMEKS